LRSRGSRATPRRLAPLLAGVGAIAILALAAPAEAAPPTPGSYQQGDYSAGNAWNIVPPGQNGFESAADAATFLLNGTRPPHQYDQNDMYANLVYAVPGLQESQIPDYYKDASFGTKPADVERTEHPNCAIVTPPSANSSHCDDVTIVRDKFGVPHVYGADRAALEFGLGYVTGEDRLFLADVLRHAGRGELSSFVGGANVAQDRDTWANAPYASDAELQLQYDRADDLYDEQYDGQGTLIQHDVQNYVDGMNQWIAEAKLDPVNKLDALYAATGHPLGPDPWQVTDVIATGALVAGIFGKGGGGELASATSLQSAREVLGRRNGRMVWRDFREADDPEAPRTVHHGRFPYRSPVHGHERGLAMPDPGSVEPVDIVADSTAPAPQSAPAGGSLGDVLEPLSEVTGASNALVISGRESETGNPIAVFGPQTGYFAPQLLMEQDAHAPASAEGPGIDARGVAFVGSNLYVQLGRGQDYAWSATSAGQDITDTYAVRLCEPGGGEPTIDSMGYRWNGECLPIEVLERTNSWIPNAADQTPPGSETMRAYRTKAGLVQARATINGHPVAYTKLRATYFHEVDSAGSFADWNSPDVVHNAHDWIESGFKDDLTFNWFYVDKDHIAYYNSGANPVRAPRTPPEFPVKGKPKFMWRNYDPDLATFDREPIETHPQVIDQRYLSSWNNKQARGYRNDSIRDYSSVYRVEPLDDRIKQGIKGDDEMSLVELINAMEDAGTVDDRGAYDVPSALKLIGHVGNSNPELQAAVDAMRAWSQDGAHRRDLDDDGNYDQADAVKTMDAWWPLWVEAEFKPTLGNELYNTFVAGIHDAPGHLGSAFQSVVYGFVDKDLRTILGEPVKAPYSRIYCGGGKLGECRSLLRQTLLEAWSTSFDDVYGSSGCTLNNGTAASPQMCHDAVNAQDVTVAAVNQFHWINRPTFQQAIRFPDHR
jgi:acyl-homoserine lactone acylase PvdQ